jgi:hypothetical protein
VARQRSNETAFVIDEDRVAASADGTYFVGLPGLWRPGEAVHPEALGLSLDEFRDVIKALDLPIKEVKVGEGRALREFKPAHEVMSSGPVPFGGALQQEAPLEPEVEGPTIGEQVTVENTLLQSGAMEEVE